MVVPVLGQDETRTPCSHRLRCRKMRSITSRSSISATMRISLLHIGHSVPAYETTKPSALAAAASP